MDINNVAYIGIGLYCLKTTVSWLWSRRKLYYLSGKVAGPISIPFLGSVVPLQLANFLNVPAKTLQDLIKKYKGFFSIWIGPRLFLITSETSDIDELQESECVTGGPPFLMNMYARAMGKGYNTKSYPENDYPEKLRDAVDPFFGKDVEKFHRAILQRNSQLLVERMDAICNEKLENISTIIKRCNADIITESLLGIESIFYKGQQDDIIQLSEIIPQTIHDRISRFWLEYDYAYVHTNIGTSQLLATSDLKYFITKSIEKRINAINGDYSHETTFMIDALLKFHINGDITSQNVLHETMSIWNLGMAMTCDSMNFLILMLAMHKNSQDKVFAEIKNYYNTHKDSPVEWEHLENFPYLKMCLNEVLRLYPSFSLLPKYSSTDFNMKSKNLTIPAGTTIVLANFINQRDEKIWDMPEKFIPERFDTQNYIKNPSVSFNLFGKHHNNHEDFGKIMLLTCAVYLLRKYEFSNDWKIDDLPIDTSAITKSSWGYKAIVTKRVW